MACVRYEVQITLRNLAGRTCELALAPSANVAELAVAVREAFGVPICAQRLMHGTCVLVDATLSLQDVFGEAQAVELTVCRRALTATEQGELNRSLVRAAASGESDSARELLKEGAQARPDVESEIPPEFCCGGITALMMALANGDEELVGELRKAGADEPDMTGTTSLGQALGCKDYPEAVRQLAAGADANVRLGRGEGVSATSQAAPLHACCAARAPGAYELAQLLVQKRADLQGADQEGDTPLAHAKYFKNDEMFALLQGRGAELSGPFYRMFGRD